MIGQLLAAVTVIASVFIVTVIPCYTYWRVNYDNKDKPRGRY